MPSFDFVGGAYQARSNTIDAQQCINLYPEISGVGNSKSVAALIGTPGLVIWAALPAGGVRGMLRINANDGFAVSGGHVYRINAEGVVSTVALNAVGGIGPVSMASNGQTVVIVTETSGIAVSVATGAVTDLIGEAFSGASRVDFVDGYFVFTQPRTGRFFVSGLYSTELDPLDFATAEGAPDNIVSMIVDHREIWLFGEQTTEVWTNTGASDFPFERIAGAYVEHGCAAAQSVAKMDNSVFWLGQDEKGKGIVWRANGYQPQRISTHAIEYQISKYTTISDAIAYCYQQDGHSFYVLTFPSADKTWVLDAATGLWHERAWRDDQNRLHRHRSNCHMSIGGRNLVGDWENGNIYVLDINAYTDNGNLISRVRACSHAASDLKNMFFSAFQVDMEAGVGLLAGQGENPQAMLQWSDDGGFTWSNEHWAGIGRMGEYKTRVRWRRLGRARDRVFRLTITDPVKVAIVGASVEVKQGAS